MGDQLYAGSLSDFDFTESMAREIEDALNEVFVQSGLQPLPPPADTPEVRDRRRFFIAIARGVIRHLEKNENAFRITVNVGDTFPATLTTYPDIQVKSDIQAKFDIQVKLP